MSHPVVASHPDVDGIPMASATEGRGLGVARLASICTVVGIAGLAGLSIWLQRGFSFIADEWDILGHYYDGHYLTPYNGHLSLVPITIYQTLASTVGLGSYRVYGTIGVAIFIAVPVAFFLGHRRTVDIRLVTIAALGIAWSWSAEWNLLYGFLMNFNIPVLMLIVSWPLIRRNDLRGDLWAMVALAVALASSSIGVVAAFAIGVELVLQRVPLRRLIRFAPPVVLWLAWWIFNHDPTKPATFGARVSYAWNVLVGILAGFTLGWKPGAGLSAVAIAVVVWMAWKKWRTSTHMSWPSAARSRSSFF